MQKKIFKKKFWILLPITAISVTLIVFLLWLYNGTLTPAKTAIFTSLPLPAALVGGSPISVKDFEFRVQLAKKLSSGKTADNITNLDQVVFDKMLLDKKYELAAKNSGIRISKAEIENAYQTRQKQMGDEYGNTFENVLKTSGITSEIFKNYILSHELLMDKLALWYNSSTQLNKSSLELAGSLLSRLKAGENMGLLARNYSQDETSIAAKGDMGFVDPLQLLPEISETVSGMQTGEYKIISSRMGTHIIFLEEKNGNLVHLRQIFIKPKGFDAWLKSQAEGINSIILLHP